MLPDVTAGAFADDRSSFVFALRGPSLWLVSLPAGTVRSIPLPSAIAGSAATISALAWDGHQLLFPGGRSHGRTSHPGWRRSSRLSDSAASHTQYLHHRDQHRARPPSGRAAFCSTRPAPATRIRPRTAATPLLSSHRTGSPIAPSRSKQERSLTSAISSTHSLHTVLLSVPVDVSGTAHPQQQTAPPFTQRLAAIDLVSGNRAFLDLPGQGSSTIDLIAERRIERQGQRHGQGQGHFAGYLTAYTTTGDCDPASTDAAQPFAPTDRARQNSQFLEPLHHRHSSSCSTHACFAKPPLVEVVLHLSARPQCHTLAASRAGSPARRLPLEGGIGPGNIGTHPRPPAPQQAPAQPRAYRLVIQLQAHIRAGDRRAPQRDAPAGALA